MKKGNLGVSLSFFAVLAFVLAICMQPLLCGLLLALVLVYEKDEWLSRQVMQAFMLSLLIALAGTLVASSRSYLIAAASQMYYSYTPVSTLGILFIGAVCIVIILAVIFAIVGITRTAKYMEANVPLFSGLADKAYGIVRRPPPPPVMQPYPPYQQAPQPFAPGQQPPPYAPAYPAAPVQQAPQAAQQTAPPQQAAPVQMEMPPPPPAPPAFGAPAQEPPAAGEKPDA